MTHRGWNVADSQEWSVVAKDLWQAGRHHQIWLLSGQMGSGKTTLVKALMKCLGSDDVVTSPTFSLVNEYRWPDGEEVGKVFHLDLYRLQSLEEILALGLEEMMDTRHHLMIEWPEIALPLFSDPVFHLQLMHSASGRKVVVL